MLGLEAVANRRTPASPRESASNLAGTRPGSFATESAPRRTHQRTRCALGAFISHVPEATARSRRLHHFLQPSNRGSADSLRSRSRHFQRAFRRAGFSSRSPQRRRGIRETIMLSPSLLIARKEIRDHLRDRRSVVCRLASSGSSRSPSLHGSSGIGAESRPS